MSVLPKLLNRHPEEAPPTRDLALKIFPSTNSLSVSQFFEEHSVSYSEFPDGLNHDSRYTQYEAIVPS